MRLPARLVSLAGAAATIAVAAAVVLSYGMQAAADVDPVTNDLCIVAPATPYDAASGLPMFAPRPVPADARCPVCGMYPARAPRWAAQLIFRDGAAHYFDSPINLFVFLNKVERYSKAYARSDVAASFVTDFESGRWVEARHAFFVHGSRVFGPMRDADLPAFASRVAAERFTRSRGGKVLTYGQVTPEVLQALNRNVHHRH